MTATSPKYAVTIIGSAGQRSVAEFDKLTDAMRFADSVSDNMEAQAEALLAQFADKYDPGK